MAVYRYMCAVCNRTRRNQPGYTACGDCAKESRHIRRAAELMSSAARQGGPLKLAPPDVVIATVWYEITKLHYPSHQVNARVHLKNVIESYKPKQLKLAAEKENIDELF